MNPQTQLQHARVYAAIPPAVIKDDAAFVSHVIDTRDLSYGEFHTLVGSIDDAPAYGDDDDDEVIVYIGRDRA